MQAAHVRDIFVFIIRRKIKRRGGEQWGVEGEITRGIMAPVGGRRGEERSGGRSSGE